MTEINLFEQVGSFAENKDKAREIRVNQILPALDRGAEVILNFEKIDSATQSFIHALISDIIRKYGTNVLDQMRFKGCNDTIKKLINIVVDYMQNTNSPPVV